MPLIFLPAQWLGDTAPVPSTTTSTRCATAPVWSATRGCPVGTGDWRLIVERLNGTGSVVGACVVGASPTGDAVVGTLQWEDLTLYVRGMEWFRGADEPFGRPRVGEMSVTLDNQSDMFTPWTEYADTRPGTVMRAGLVSAVDVRADGWLPLWCGLVDSWQPLFHGVRSMAATVYDAAAFADATVEIHLVETLSVLARVDDNAGTLEGSGELPTERFGRLLTAAAWKFGMAEYALAVGEIIGLQSTDMSANRLTEMYLTADSSVQVIRSDVTGAVVLTDTPRYSYSNVGSRLADFSNDADPSLPMLGFQPKTDATSAGIKRLVYDAESLLLVNDPQHLVNDHRYARVGGTQQVVEHTVSIGRFGRSSRARSDLISVADSDVSMIAGNDNRREARTTIRVDELTVTATGKDEYYLCVAALDVGNWATVWLDEAPGARVTCVTRSMSHRVTPLQGRVAWEVTFAFDTDTLDGFPDGAILDALP